MVGFFVTGSWMTDGGCSNMRKRARRVGGKTSRLVRRSPLGVETITQQGVSGPRPVFTDLPMRGRGGGEGGKRRFGNDYGLSMGLKRLAMLCHQLVPLQWLPLEKAPLLAAVVEVVAHHGGLVMGLLEAW